MSIDNVGSSDPKTMLMNQVKQEAALNNARQLIEVLPSPSYIQLCSHPF